MTNFQKAFCIFLSLCFFAVLAVMPGRFFLRGNVYRQLPLYCFLEDKATGGPMSEDEETYEKIVAENGDYLGEKIREDYEKTHVKKEDKAIEADPEQENTPDNISDNTSNNTEEKTQETLAVPHPVIDLSPEKLTDFDYVMNHFFIVDSGTKTSEEQLNATRFLGMDMTVKEGVQGPQILIYHSHSQEAFADSREGKREDTIVGVGDYLTEILTKTYGYEVLHVTEAFDMESGELDRSGAYDYAREYLEPLLEKQPQIEVLIDLHRDGVASDRRLVTKINGKDTAQIMFYNGLSYTLNQGTVDYLPNPYIQDNLAFSFQLEYQSALYYPDFYRGIYLAGYRYNLHLRPKSILLEAGAQTNTVQEVKNAMEPFAHILDLVLRGK